MSETWTTYRMADDSLICGNYSYVSDEDYFDDIEEPVKVVKETWVLQKSETVVFEPSWWSEDYDEYESTEKIRRKNNADDLF